MKNRKKYNNKVENKPKQKKQSLKINLFGVHAVTQAWLNPQRSVNNLYLTKNVYDAFKDNIIKSSKNCLKRPEPIIINKETLDNSLPQGSVHQGIAMNAGPLPEYDINDIINAKTNSAREVILILDQVTDPHNVGAIIRSACALGAKGIIMQKKHAPELKTILAKTACGAIEHIKLANETNLSRTVDKLKECGYMIIGLDERGEKNIGEIDKTEKIALILGAEGSGIRHLLKEKCDILVKLPTNPPIMSLNVSNAAAISLYIMLN